MHNYQEAVLLIVHALSTPHIYYLVLSEGTPSSSLSLATGVDASSATNDMYISEGPLLQGLLLL